MSNNDYILIKEYKDYLKGRPSVKRLDALLLDSSLITRTFPFLDYNCKVIKCGKYVQVYKKNRVYSRKKKDYELIKQHENIIDEDFLFSNENEYKEEPSLKEIEERNIIRSKNQMCRLILSNEDKFKTFITLTFKDEIKDIKVANKHFQNFIRKIKRAFPSELFYVAVPEFQKNHKVHYHLLTNINYTDDILINENISLRKLYQKDGTIANVNEYLEENITLLDGEHMNDKEIVLRYQNGVLHNTKKTFNHKTGKIKIFKTIKYWSQGFSSVIELSSLCGDNIAGYMSKYMLKDIDNRLFGHRRYFYSLNLDKPVETYLNTFEEFDNLQYNLMFDECDIKYQNNYKSAFDEDIEFYELKYK